MTCFDCNGSANATGRLVYETIDPAVSELFRKLVSDGYGVNEIFSMIVLSASDARAEIVLARRFKEDGAI